MFTGIVTHQGTVTGIEPCGETLRLTIESEAPLRDVALGASIACNGICLTVTQIDGRQLTFDATPETAKVTTLGRWQIGRRINLERALKFGDELGGHLVSGHVDGTARVAEITSLGQSWVMRLEAPEILAPLLVPKGSVTLDGVSLTINSVDGAIFSVAIIPHTLAVTTLGRLRKDDRVNMEVETAARYAQAAGSYLQPAPLSPIEEIIADARAGRMFILIDDEDRENEGDLVIPAQFADAGAVNFMAKYGRGLICLALTPERVQQLGLKMMSEKNESSHHTAFTVSIEAREGVTTGISAADRAETIAVAIGHNRGKQDLVSPGHIFPLRAAAGGVLERRGHTEASVEIARLAGLDPSGVICEIMNDDGSMARLPDLQRFAALHNLKIATIADLVAYCRKQVV